MLFVLLGFLLIVGNVNSGAVPNIACGTNAQCTSPVANLVELIKCYLTNLLDTAGLTKLVNKVATLVCNGTTMDQLSSQFLSICQQSASLATYSKLLSAGNDFGNCVKPCPNTLNNAISQFSSALKTTYGSLYTQAQQIGAPYKTKNTCASIAAINAVVGFGCKQFTTTMVSKSINATFKIQGKCTAICDAKILDPSILKLAAYPGVTKS